ncbi:MAG: hypothetical protein M3209_04425 [Acidobacteriota bacterium]|nr:hypothetical protein [Acidobacteriota bacterium]
MNCPYLGTANVFTFSVCRRFPRKQIRILLDRIGSEMNGLTFTRMERETQSPKSNKAIFEFSTK